MTGYKYKKYLERDQVNMSLYVCIYGLEVTWNESVSDLLDITLCNNSTQINFAVIKV